MDDLELKDKLLSILLKLEKKVDWWADTPKRHKAGEHIKALRKLLNEPTTKGYGP